LRRRRGATASVDGKSEKVAVPFGAYLLCKRLLPSCALRRPRRSRTVACTRPPPLTPNDWWARAHQSMAWPLEERGKGGIRTARAAGWARIRQESEPPHAHGAGGGRAPWGSRFGRKDIHALTWREQAVHPAQCWDLAPPAGSSLTRGGPGGLCRYIRTGVPPARVSRPLASQHPRSPPRLLGDVAYGPGLTAGTMVSGPSPGSKRSGASTCPGRQGSSRVAPAVPDSPGRSGAATCDDRTITGLTAPTGLGGPDPPSPRKGSGATTCRPHGGSGAGPATCLWQEALRGSPIHLPVFNAVAGLGAPKSKSVACH
jgi:hypothetical protein